MENKIKEVKELFKKLNIPYDIVYHKPLFGADDNDEDIDFKGMVCKNLFLTTKKKDIFLLYSLPINKRADLKSIASILNTKRLEFGNEDLLLSKLNIKRGSVSVLNIILKKDTDVLFILDKDMFKYSRVSFHPNDNHASFSFSPNDILKILDFFNAKYKIVEI